jgi:uncharacterized integral membrane protein
MLRWLRFLFLGLLAIVLVTVALANRGPVTVRALPEDLAAVAGLEAALTLPLFLVIFASLAAGVLLGFVWEWLREAKHRGLASRKSREAAALERELAAMRDAKGVVQDDVLALLERPKP